MAGRHPRVHLPVESIIFGTSARSACFSVWWTHKDVTPLDSEDQHRSLDNIFLQPTVHRPLHPHKGEPRYVCSEVVDVSCYSNIRHGLRLLKLCCFAKYAKQYVVMNCITRIQRWEYWHTLIYCVLLPGNKHYKSVYMTTRWKRFRLKQSQTVWESVPNCKGLFYKL